MSTRCALMSSRPSSNTANRPMGPAPMIRTSVLIVSLIDIVPAEAGSLSCFLGSSRRPAVHVGIGNGDQVQQLRQILLGCLAGGGERYLRLGVKRLATLENGNEILHGAGAVGDRSHVALRHDALHMLLRIGADPPGQAGRPP